MPDTIEQIRTEIADRLRNVEAEADSLRAALDALGGSSPRRSAPTRPARAKSTNSKGRRSSAPTPPVSKATLERILKHAAAHPDVTVESTTKYLQMHTNTVRKGLKHLAREGQLAMVGRQGDRKEHFVLAESPDETPVAA